MQKLNWGNIKVGLCPKCSYKLKVVGLLEPYYQCPTPTCDFKMGEDAYKRIIESMQKSQEKQGFSSE